MSLVLLMLHWPPHSIPSSGICLAKNKEIWPCPPNPNPPCVVVVPTLVTLLQRAHPRVEKVYKWKISLHQVPWSPWQSTFSTTYMEVTTKLVWPCRNLYPQDMSQAIPPLSQPIPLVGSFSLCPSFPCFTAQQPPSYVTVLPMASVVFLLLHGCWFYHCCCRLCSCGLRYQWSRSYGVNKRSSSHDSC